MAWMLVFMQRVPSPGLPSSICSISELQCDMLASRCSVLSLLQTFDNQPLYTMQAEMPQTQGTGHGRSTSVILTNIIRTIVLQPLCRSTCVSQHLQLRTGGFCWCFLSFTASMPLVMATSAFGLGRRCWSSPQHCYLHSLHTCNTDQ